MRSNQKPGIQIAWKTVTYRSVILFAMAILVALLVATRFTFPEFSANTEKTVSSLFTNLLERVAIATDSRRRLSLPAGAHHRARRNGAHQEGQQQ